MRRFHFRSFALVLSIWSGSAAIASESVPLLTQSGMLLHAEIRTPPRGNYGTKQGARLPAILLFGGFQNAGRVLDLLPASELAKFPVILASFDYPFEPPRKFEFPESLRFAPEAKRMLQDTHAGILELRRVLAARSDVDPSRIYIVGASLGSPFAVRAAAEDPRFRGAALIHAFGDVPATTAHQLVHSWQAKWGPFGFLARPAAWLFAQLAWRYLDFPTPEQSAASFSPGQRILMITAENDSFIPRAASDSLWNSIRRSQAVAERQFMPGDHLQPGSDALIVQLLKRVIHWMELGMEPDRGSP